MTVFRGAGFDRYGDRTPPTSAHVVEGCAWSPRTSGAGPSTHPIDTRGRQGVLEGLTVYAEHGADIVHTDQVALDVRVSLADYGTVELWDVNGEVGSWQSPFTGRRAGVEFSISRAEG